MVRGQKRCPDCGRGYDEAPSPSRMAMARVVRAMRSIRISGPTFVVLLLIATPLTFFTMQFRAQRKGQTADHIRNVKKTLEIWSGQYGGFPESLEQMSKMGGGPAPMAHELVDGWGKPLRYTPRRPLFKNEFGQQAYAEYDLRSAGPDGTFDDEDDMSWTGKVDDGPGPGVPPMPMR